MHPCVYSKIEATEPNKTRAFPKESILIPCHLDSFAFNQGSSPWLHADEIVLYYLYLKA
jgi:hypothetical protein